jgi:hypothetical protein
VKLHVPSYDWSPSSNHPSINSQIITQVTTKIVVFLRSCSSTHANVSGEHGVCSFRVKVTVLLYRSSLKRLHLSPKLHGVTPQKATGLILIIHQSKIPYHGGSDKLKLLSHSYVFHVIQQLNSPCIRVIRDCLLITSCDTISKRKMWAEEGDARPSNLPDTGGEDTERGAWLCKADVLV